MRRIVSYFQNERGNIGAFVLTIFTFMLLVLFTALFNFSTVFVDKDRAEQIAMQASQAGLKDIYEEMENAIRTYDTSPARYEDPVFITPDLVAEELSVRAAHPDWATSEVHYTAIDNVLSNWLPGNPELQAYVQAGMATAKIRVRQAIITVLRENNATMGASSYVIFNSDKRIEVQAAVTFQSETLGFEFLPDHREVISQTAESRKIDFLDKVAGW